MDLDDYPLLGEPNVTFVALKTASVAPAVPDDCLWQLQKSVRQAHMALPDDLSELKNRVAMAFHYLCVAGLLDPDENGRCTITQRGEQVLQEHPKGIDPSVLVMFPEFRAFIRSPRRYTSQDNGELPAESNPAYDAGYAARLQGNGLTDNPYEFDTFSHQEWENGWCEAHDEFSR